MIVQLSLSEVQVAVVEYLRKRGAAVEAEHHVQLEIVDRSGARMDIAHCTPVVIVTNMTLPDGGPYRVAAAGALKP